MEKEEIRIILENQRRFFDNGQTLDINYRLETLKKLKSLIISYDQEIKDALWNDFHKPAFEVMATETEFVLKELNLAIRKLSKWAGRKRVKTPIVHFITHSYVVPQPYGQVLVLSPWNFPFQLTMLPDNRPQIRHNPDLSGEYLSRTKPGSMPAEQLQRKTPAAITTQ